MRDLLGPRYQDYVNLMHWTRVHSDISRCFPLGDLPKFLRHALLDEMPSSRGDCEDWAFQQLGDALQDLQAGREAEAESRALALQLQMQSRNDTYSHRVSLGCAEILRDLGEPIDDRGVAFTFHRAKERCVELARQWTTAGDPLRYCEAMIILGTLLSHFQRMTGEHSPAVLYFDTAIHLLKRLPKRDPVASLLVEALLRKAEHLTGTLGYPERAKEGLDFALHLAEDEIGSPTVLFEVSQEMVDFNTAWQRFSKAELHLERARNHLKHFSTDPFQAALSLRRREIPLLSAMERESEAYKLLSAYSESWNQNPCAFHRYVLEALFGTSRFRSSAPLRPVRLKCGIAFFYSDDWIKGCVLR